MACRANKAASTTSQLCKSSGGGGGGNNSSAFIARGDLGPLLQNIQNNNHSKSTREKRDYLPNYFCGDWSAAEFASAIFDEMAGDIRLVDGKKPRKLWTLRGDDGTDGCRCFLLCPQCLDRSTMSVHLLKANLAEDGCEEAQLDVAKKLLQDSRNPTFLDSVQKENSRLAIYWLIKSSEQGNEEATRLLKECLSSGSGITGQNILDVRTCISTPTNEKLTFKAARLLHVKLNNGEEFITTTQLQSRMHEVKKKVQFQEPVSSRQESPNDSYNEGEESIISGSGRDSRSSSVDNLNSAEHVGMNTTFTYPRQTAPDVKYEEESINLDDTDTRQSLSPEQLSNQEGVKLTIHDLLKVAGSFNSGNLPRPTISSSKKELKRHNWELSNQANAFIAQLLMLAAISGTIKVTYCCIYFAAWASIWASYNVLVWKKRHSNFQDWSEAFKSVLVKDTWSDDKPENKLIMKFLLPYLFCLAASLVFLTILDGLIFLKAVLGILVMFSVFRGAMGSRIPSWRILLIFEIGSIPRILGKIATEMDSILESNISQQASDWKKEFVQQLEAYLIVPSQESVILTLQMMLVLSLVWRRRNSLLRESIPEILFAFWFLEFSQISLGLDATEIYVCCALSTVLILTFILLESQLDNVKVSIAVAGVVLLVLSGLCFSVNPSSFRRVLIGSESPSSSEPMLYDNIDNFKHIEWDEYDTNCHRKAWTSMSPAETQIKCFLKYAGNTPTAIRWIGRLSVMKVREMERSNKDDNVIKEASFELNMNILVSEGSGSTSWQSYLPGSDNQHSTPASILVSTQSLSTSREKQDLIDHFLNLRTGDKFEFHGLLSKDSVGSLKPQIVNLQSLKCVSCIVAENYVEFYLKPRVNRKLNADISTIPTLYSGHSTTESNETDYLSYIKEYVELVKSYL